jgi:hypothetical protein
VTASQRRSSARVTTTLSCSLMASTVFYFAEADSNVTVNRTTTAVESHVSKNLTNSVSLGATDSLMSSIRVLLSVIGSVGIVVNGFVAFALFAFKDFRKNTTNVFIGNQSLIDVIACIALVATSIIQKTGISNYTVGFNKRILCWFFDNTTFLGAAMNASKFSLVVITLERYFKVVHSVKYRNKLRPWMIKLGIIVPWLDGLFLVIFPISLTSYVVDGVCRKAIEKPEFLKSYNVFRFIWHFLLPLITFVVCYTRMIWVVRRQNRIVAETRHAKSSTAVAVTRQPPSGVNINVSATNEFSMRVQDGASHDNKHLSHAEKKITRMMVTITTCFIICWFPIDFYAAMIVFVPNTTISTTGNLIMTVLSYTNIVLNAVIYSSHLGIIRHSQETFHRFRNRPTGCSNEVLATKSTSVTLGL